MEGIISIGRHAPELQELIEAESKKDCLAPAVRIGVAQDEAFSFYYPESLDVLKSMGAEIVPFSPLRDKELPKVDGLLFSGGFPEMFVKELADNVSMRQSIYKACQAKMPIYARVVTLCI